MNTKGLIIGGGLGSLGLLAAALAVLMGPASAAESGNSAFSTYVDAQGQISRPTGFRQNWPHMGTWYVPDAPSAAGPGMHDVYASPGTVEAYNETGEFPDGAVLVKHISATRAEALTTGKAHYAGDTKVWFVMIKDRKNRFPDNPIWGEGWGWALFKADAPMVNVNENWKQSGLSNCYGCHVPATQTDWVFTQGYPALTRNR